MNKCSAFKLEKNINRSFHSMHFSYFFIGMGVDLIELVLNEHSL
jgi:hypothetical protein